MSRKRRRKGRAWSYSAGSYPATVRCYERRAGGTISAATYDQSLRGGKGGEHRISLGHRDRQRAQDYADSQAKKLRAGLADGTTARPTVRRVFGLYRQHRTADKGTRQQREDPRAAKRWLTHLSGDFDVSQLSRREWDSFERDRRMGRLGSDGSRVEDPELRRQVGPRTVQKDLVWLRSVCRWAAGFRDGGGFLLERDPTQGLPMPREKNPKRPCATHDRVEILREHYRKPRMRVEWDGRREERETYLPELVELAVGTGRRIGAICALRAEDLRLDRTPEEPHGAIVWSADTDKMSKEWRCPISPTVRQALESALRKRQAVGHGPLFPAPSDPREPVKYRQATEWLREAEEAAKLERLDGGAWHPFRRLWASCRKDLPDVDVARAGGWSSLDALRMAYQRPDAETVLKVVLHEAELREVR